LAESPPLRAPASLQRHILWLLLGVVGMFASGIALSIWFSLRAGSQEQQNLLQLEATQTRISVIRLLDYYHMMLDKAARDPDLIDLMRVGTIEEQQEWAVSRQRLLPDLLGVALVNPHGEVLGDALSLRIGPRCQQDMQRADTLRDVRPLLHREVKGAEHFDLVKEVHDTGGEVLGGIFLSVRLSQLQRVIDDSIHPGHALVILDAAGNTIARQGEVSGNLREIRLKIPATGWTLIAQSPIQFFTLSGKMQVLAGLVTLGAVLLLLAMSLLRVRRAMLNDIVSTRDALTALARDEPVPAIVPHYTEFETAADDINVIALHLQEQRARLEHLSLTDPLTGLPNRRAFETVRDTLPAGAGSGRKAASCRPHSARYRLLQGCQRPLWTRGGGSGSAGAGAVPERPDPARRSGGAAGRRRIRRVVVGYRLRRGGYVVPATG